MNRDSINHKIEELISSAGNAFSICHQATNEPSVTPQTLKDKAAECVFEDETQADLFVLLANMMGEHDLDRLSCDAVQTFIQGFVCWLYKADFNEIDWTYQPVECEAEKRIDVLMDFNKEIERYSLRVSLPFSQAFDAAASLYQCAILIDAHNCPKQQALWREDLIRTIDHHCPVSALAFSKAQL